MLRSTIKDKIIIFISNNFIKESATILDDDTSLLEEGILDSTGVIELVSFIEATFEIRVEDEEIIPENLESINRIVDFIKLKVAKNARH